MTRLCLGLILCFTTVVLAENVKEVRNEGLSHWGLHGGAPPRETEGASWYTMAFNFLQTGYPIREFQIGLASTWLIPDGVFDPDGCPCTGATQWCTDGTCKKRGGCRDVFETMEGGLGYWRNELPYPNVKWRLNEVNGCYAQEMMSHHFGFLGDTMGCNELGFVQLNNRFLLAPDGISFTTPNGMLGQSFMRTTIGCTAPFTSQGKYLAEKTCIEPPYEYGGSTVSAGCKASCYNDWVSQGRETACDSCYGWGHDCSCVCPINTTPQDIPKNCQTYMLILDTENFSGPVGYTLEDFWLDNKADPTTPDFSHTGLILSNLAFEINGLKAYGASSNSGASYLKIPKIAFPVDNSRVTEIAKGVRTWGSDGLKDPLECFLSGRCTYNPSSFMTEQLATKPACPSADRNLQLGFADHPRLELKGNLRTRSRNDDCLSEILWDNSAGSVSVDNMLHIWEYWKQDGATMIGQTRNQLPAELTELPRTEYPEKTWSHVPKLDARNLPCAQNPAPSFPYLYCVYSGSGSWVGFKWYRYIDQPAMKRVSLTANQKAFMQLRVEKLHRAMNAGNNRWLKRPSGMSPSSMVKLDPAMLLVPPVGLEVGFVPIALYEGQTRPSECKDVPHVPPTPTGKPTPTGTGVHPTGFPSSSGTAPNSTVFTLPVVVGCAAGLAFLIILAGVLYTRRIRARSLRNQHGLRQTHSQY